MGIIFAPTILRPRMAISSSTLSTATSSGTSSGVSSKLTSPTNLVGSGLPTAASIAAAAAQPLDEYEKSAAVIEYLIDYAPEFKLTSDSIRLFEVLDMKRLHIDGEEVQNSRVSSFDMINVVASQKSVSPSAAVTSPTKIVSGDDVFSVKEILNSIAPPPLRPPISPTSPSQPQPPTLSPAAPVTTSSSFVSSDLESAQQSSAPDSSNLSKPNVKLPPITSLPAVPKFATFSFNMDNIIKKVDEKEEFSSLAGSRIEEEEENDNGHKLVKRGTRKSTTNTSDHYGQGGAQFPNSSL